MSTAAEEAQTFQIFSTIRYDPSLLSRSENTSNNAGATLSYALLPYHRDRLLRAARAFEWSVVVGALSGAEGFEKLQTDLDEAISRWKTTNGKEHDDTFSLRIRLSYSPTSIEPKIEIFPCTSISPISNFFDLSNTTPFELDSLSQSPSFTYIKVKLDPFIPTESISSPFYAHKTTQRDHYIDARRRTDIDNDYVSSEVLLFNPHKEVTEGSIANVAVFRENEGWITPDLEDEDGLKGVMRRWLIENKRWKPGTVKKEELSQGDWVLLSNALRGCFVGRIE